MVGVMMELMELFLRVLNGIVMDVIVVLLPDVKKIVVIKMVEVKVLIQKKWLKV